MVFTKDTKIREITQHPSFRGFGHFIIPLQLAFHPEETVQDVTDSNHFYLVFKPENKDQFRGFEQLARACSKKMNKSFSPFMMRTRW